MEPDQNKQYLGQTPDEETTGPNESNDQPVLSHSAPRVISPLTPIETAPEPVQTSEPRQPTVTPPITSPSPTVAPAVSPSSTLNDTQTPQQPATPAPEVNPINTPAVVTAAPAGIVVNGQPTAPGATQPAGSGSTVIGTLGAKRAKKKLFLLGGGVAAVVLLAVGGVFGLYLPNTPDNVWSTGVNRTGTALDKLVSSATDSKQLASYKTSTVSGSLKATFDKSTYGGDFSTTFDRSNLNGNLNVKFKPDGSTEQTLNAKVLSQLQARATYPNIYFQLNGIKNLGLDDLVPGLSGYDGKWIKVSSDYLQSLGSSYIQSSSKTENQVTAQDISNLAQTATDVTRQYVFTTDADKAVLVKKSFVGKETVDGVKAYHYTAGINQAHLKDYCVAISNAVLSSDVYKKLGARSSSDVEADKKNVAKSCQDEQSNNNKTFDVWIGGKYRLIHKVRVYEASNRASYMEFGQNIKSNSQLQLFVNYHEADPKSDTHATADIDFDKKTTKVNVDYKDYDADYPTSFSMNLQASPSDKRVTVTPPSSTTDIQTLLKSFGFDPSATGLDNTSSDGGSGLTVSTSTADSLKTTNIGSLQAQLESVYSVNDSYPTLAQINSSSWRQANFQGFDDTALQATAGGPKQLATTASANQFGYMTTDCTASGCHNFTLSAILANGSSYTKSSNN